MKLQPLVDAMREVVLRHGGVHADETPVQMLATGAKITHCAYFRAYFARQFFDLAEVVYDVSSSRAGEHARAFLGNCKGKLDCDDLSGYTVEFERGVTEIGCIGRCAPQIHRFACDL